MFRECSSMDTVNFEEQILQISARFFRPNDDYCVYYIRQIFFATYTRRFEDPGISLGYSVSLFQLGNIQSREEFMPKARESAMDLHTIQGRVEILSYSLRDKLLQAVCHLAHLQTFPYHI